MKKYALILLLVAGLSGNAWGYGFTSLSNTCFVTNACHVSSLNLCPTLGLYPTLGLSPILSPSIGLMSTSLMCRPSLLCGGTVYQSTNCSDVNYQGVTVYQSTIGNHCATTSQSSVNLQVHSSSVQICNP